MTKFSRSLLAALLLALSFGADAASLYVAKWTQFHTDAGDPCNGCKLYFYVTTTTTPKNTYPTEADAIAGTNANANPVVLDSDGRVPQEIWISGRYRLITKTSADVTIADDDPIEDVVTGSDSQDSASSWCGTVGGTANAITCTLSPVPTAYTDGMAVRLRLASDNSSTVTINVNSLGAKSVVKFNGAALVSGDLQQNDTATLVYDSTNNRFQLHSLNDQVLRQGVHTIPVLASAMVSRTTNGAASGVTELATNDVMLSSKDFDQTTSEGVQFHVPMPKSWNESTITANFGWTAASGAGTVTWSLGCTAFGDDDAMDTAFGSAQSVTDTLLTANDLHITGTTSAITVGGTPAENDFVICQITRDISDTLNADAKLLWARVFVTLNAANDE